MNHAEVKGNGALCHLCTHWRPHVHFPFIGLCALWGRLTFEDDSCGEFRRLSLEGELFWCATCKTRLSREEARRHAEMLHRVYLGAYIDPDVREEIYDAF